MTNSIDELTSLGFAVFPVNGKVPYDKGGFKTATDDYETAVKLFKPHNGCNIAVATGEASGVFVLDIDIKQGAKGDESLKQLIKEYSDLPTTASVRTWSGGYHYYFDYPHDVPVSCRTGLRPGIDIRGDGGYVVAPPSIIKNKPYEWMNHPDKVKAAAAPDWLIQLIIKHKPQIAETSDGGQITQNRNDTLMYVGAGLRKIGFDAARINDLLQEVNRTRCVPLLPEAEVTKIANSVARYAAWEERRAPLTDVYNAKFFTDTHGEDAVHCDPMGGWHMWDEERWQRDDSYLVMTMAKKTAKMIREIGISKGDKDMAKHGTSTESKARLESMIALAKSNGITIKADQFDHDHMVLNCKNGLLDLTLQELGEHRREAYCTKLAPVAYNARAKCPRWEQFLMEIFSEDKDLIEFIQKAIGYSLSGNVSEQCFFILYGTGSNGKSTFLKHIQHIMGDYALSTPASSLMEKHNEGIPNDIARLKGARFVTTTESSQKKQLNESLIKQLTGEDAITARFLRKEYFDFYATFKIFLATNHRPNIKGNDPGIWRRLITIPFNRFISKEERDPELDETLREEYPGILAWAVRGYKMWQEGGLATESVRAIEDLKNTYKEEQDILGQFISEECVKSPGVAILASTFNKKVKDWCIEGNMRPISRVEINNYLQERGYEKGRGTTGLYSGKNVWYGLGAKVYGQEDDEDNG